MSYSNDFENAFWDEIFGCVKYLKLDYETVMSMPIYLRKFWIRKHNQDEEKRDKEREQQATGTKTSSIDPIGINTYAKLEQQNLKNGMR